MILKKECVKKICKKKFKNCEIEKIREIKEAGKMNPIFEIKITNPNLNLILKTYGKKWEHYKPDKEKFIFELIKKETNLPVPEIYILDKGKKIIPYTYLLMNKMEGKMPKSINISKSEKENIYFQLGKDLSKLHEIKLNNFGWIYKDKVSKHELNYEKPFDNWYDFFIHKFEEVKEEVRGGKNKRYGKLTKEKIEELFPIIEEKIKISRTYLSKKIKPSFIHNDFSLENVLIKKDKIWKITAILDVEVAMSGDSEFELAQFYMDILIKDKHLRESFLKGYLSTKKLSKDFQEKLVIYKIYSYLSLISFEGFELGNATIKEINYFYKKILELLKNDKTS
jgi:fructosamine-3-kinase